MPPYISCRFQPWSLSKNHMGKNYMVHSHYLIKQAKIQLPKKGSPMPSEMARGARDYQHSVPSVALQSVQTNCSPFSLRVTDKDELQFWNLIRLLLKEFAMFLSL